MICALCERLTELGGHNVSELPTDPPRRMLWCWSSHDGVKIGVDVTDDPRFAPAEEDP